jgi:hypothetical protein
MPLTCAGGDEDICRGQVAFYSACREHGGALRRLCRHHSVCATCGRQLRALETTRPMAVVRRIPRGAGWTP